MKMNMKLLGTPTILLLLACSNGVNTGEKKTEISIAANENSGDGIAGEWMRIGSGEDENDNGKLDESEMKTNDPGLRGVDYLHFFANGKCVYDKDMKFDGVYTVKMDKNKKAIFIYPAGLPAGLSAGERDKNALVFRIASVEEKKLFLKPAHLVGKFVVYKRM